MSRRCLCNQSLAGPTTDYKSIATSLCLTSSVLSRPDTLSVAVPRTLSCTSLAMMMTWNHGDRTSAPCGPFWILVDMFKNTCYVKFVAGQKRLGFALCAPASNNCFPAAVLDCPEFFAGQGSTIIRGADINDLAEATMAMMALLRCRLWVGTGYLARGWPIWCFALLHR